VKIQHIERFGTDQLLDALKRTRLRGFDAPMVYESASLELIPALDTGLLCPAQRYVLRSGVAQVLELHDALLPLGVDVFALEGGAMIRTAENPDELIPVIPPIIEESREPDGRVVNLINDGIHRVYAARSIGRRISVVLARNVPLQYPYYAFALPNGWADVTEIDELPDSFQKKAYRQPDNYKALFRDFNAVFPGVQKQRKQSNPQHLRA
jgi:hypothetical protein